MNYQIAFKLAGEWYPLGFIYASREKPEARIEHMRVHIPTRECKIVETEEPANA